MQMRDLMGMLYSFGMDFQIYQCQKLFPSINEKCIIEWYRILRDVCSTSLLKCPAIFGEGTDTDIIEIHESLFGKKRKYHRGTGNQKFWVFGTIKRNTKQSDLQLVEKRDKATLGPIINKRS